MQAGRCCVRIDVQPLLPEAVTPADTDTLLAACPAIAAAQAAARGSAGAAATGSAPTAAAAGTLRTASSAV